MSHIIETKCLYEGMFPDSEQAFIFHEMLEIVNHLHLFGPATPLMCFAGERTMKKIGDCVTDGGQKYIISVDRKYAAKEKSVEANMKSYTESKERYTDNSERYSGMVLKLTKKFVKVSLDYDAKDRLFNSIQEFLATQEISDLVVKSPFVRLYFTYEGLYKSYVERTWTVPDGFPSTFARWVGQLYALSATDDISTDSARELVHHVLVDEDCTVGWAVKSPEHISDLAVSVMENIVDKGAVYLSDFRGGIIEQLAKFATSKQQPIAAFTHAVVKGVMLSGRGPKCVENELVMEDLSGTNAVGLSERFLIQNPMNVLSNNWYVQPQINSWCKISDYYVHYITKLTKQVKKRHYLGQLNYFFRLYLPCDTMLNGVAFANVVLRQTDFSPIRGCHSIVMRRGEYEDHSYYPHKQFVPVNYIDSTALSVTAFDVKEMPMMSPTATMKRAKDIVKDYPLCYSNEASSDVFRLDFVELHKERLHLEYLSIEQDRDSTKVFESSVLQHHCNSLS